MTPTRRRLLDAILANPDDALPRLAYADWLEDEGEEIRAKFIRQQIEHMPVAPPLTVVYNVEAFFGCEPHRCFRHGMKEHALSNFAVAMAFQKPEESHRAYWRRGFISELHGPLASILKHGPAVCREHPVERVEVQGLLGHRCPVCDSPGQWRRGVGFEHEKICMRTAHAVGRNIVWEPEGHADNHVNRAVLAEIKQRAAQLKEEG